MTRLLLAAVTAAWTIAAALVSHRQTRRTSAAARLIGPTAPRPLTTTRRTRDRRSPMTTVGTRLRQALLPGNPPAGDRRLGWAAITGLALLPVAPPLAPLPIAAALAGPVVTGRAAHRRKESAVVDQLPDVVDLVTLTTAAGLPVAVALGAIGDRPGGPVGTAVARAAAHVDRGGTTADALAHVAALGPPARPLVDALTQHDRYGTPLLPALDRVAIEARAHRRRRAEESARRLPVTLLFPLVLTTLPAFVLLVVVPLLAGSLQSLSA